MDGGRFFPEFGDPSKWELIDQKTLVGESLGRNRWGIPKQRYELEQPVCLIGIRNRFAPATWTLGGWASQMLRRSAVAEAELVFVQNRRCRLGTSLIIFPEVVSPENTACVLEISFPRWHTEVMLEVWKYIGRDISMVDWINGFELVSPTLPNT